MDEVKVPGINAMHITDDTYKKMLEIARKENKSVADVTAEALNKHITEKQQIAESKKKLLMEG